MKLPKRTTVRRTLIALGLAGAIVASTAGCSSNQINPDAIGLVYTAGWSEGKKFDKALDPGATDFTVNDEVKQLPTSQRSYIIRKDSKADINGVISVPSQDGTLVDFEVSTAFKLNTLTDDIDGFKGGTARRFYEDLCRHYKCDLEDGKSPGGWDTLLREKLYPQLESAFKDEARKYTGDAIVNNSAIKGTETGTLTKLQADVGELFLKYLERQTGAKFFCGPSFDRKTNKKCGNVELLIISADYNNSKVRESREAKKVAGDQSAAQVALQNALKDPNYLRYLEIQAMRECAQSAKAVCVFDAGRGNVSVQAPK